MSLGLGVFLAALVIAVVMLRDKVRWGRLFLGAFVLVALVGSGVYLYNWYASLPTYQSKYEGVAIGMDRDEVRYVKGSPTTGFYPTVEQKQIDEGKNPFEAWLAGFIDTGKLPRDLTTNDASRWVYKNLDAFIRVYFDEKDRVNRIECNAPVFYQCDTISGVGLGSSESEVKSVFGNPDTERISEFGFKHLRFDKYNVQFVLEKQNVTEIIVGEPRLAKEPFPGD